MTSDFWESSNFVAADWLVPISPDFLLTPGLPSPELISIPQGDAQSLLREVVRLVADLPKGSNGDVVWTLGRNELLVHTEDVRLKCTSGVVTISIPVACDEVAGQPVEIPVPLGVGTQDVPAGLVMNTFSALEGPSAITSIWSDAIVAFAWESLLELTREVAGAVGRDSRGKRLIPGSVAASPNVLHVQPVARPTSKVLA